MVSETPARPVEADEVFRIIRERLADILEIEEGRITLEAGFTEDLSADSLALIALVEAIEQELEDRAPGFRIEDEDLAELRTVRGAVDYVVERVGAGARARHWPTSPSPAWSNSSDGRSTTGACSPAPSPTGRSAP